MCPGAWVIINGGLEFKATACGVTPQAPEHRLFARPDFHPVPEIRTVNIGDSDGLWAPDVDRGAVCRWEPGSHLHCPHNLLPANGPHAHNHRPGKHPGRRGRNVGDVHGYVAPHGLVPQLYARVRQRLFKGETAPQKERDQPVVPVVQQRGDFPPRIGLPRRCGTRERRCGYPLPERSGPAPRCPLR